MKIVFLMLDSLHAAYGMEGIGSTEIFFFLRVLVYFFLAGNFEGRFYFFLGTLIIRIYFILFLDVLTKGEIISIEKTEKILRNLELLFYPRENLKTMM